MITVKQIDPDDLPLYAMHLLPASEMAEISESLQHSTEARRMLSDILGELAIYACSAETQAPPEAARERLTRQVAREKKAIPIDLQQQAARFAEPTEALVEPEARRQSLPARVLPWLGWAAAAALAISSATLFEQRGILRQQAASQHVRLAATQASLAQANEVLETIQDSSAVRVSLTPTGVAPPPEGRAIHVPQKGALVFLASNLEPLQSNKTYELWLIPEGGQDAIAAGTFQPDARGNAEVLLPPLPKGVQAKAFGVTVEDGSGSSSPTLPIVLKGAVT